MPFIAGLHPEHRNVLFIRFEKHPLKGRAAISKTNETIIPIGRRRRWREDHDVPLPILRSHAIADNSGGKRILVRQLRTTDVFLRLAAALRQLRRHLVHQGNNIGRRTIRLAG
jgi:hypothetical protein